jgi:hypothetical protein
MTPRLFAERQIWSENSPPGRGRQRVGSGRSPRRPVRTACDENADLPSEPFRETPAGAVFPRKAILRPPPRLLPPPANEVQYLYLRILQLNESVGTGKPGRCEHE